MPPTLSMLAACLAGVLFLAVPGNIAHAERNATSWVQGHNSRVRVLFGGRPTPGGHIARFAAIEIHLAEGWKTYWRQPGTAGGIPPVVDWSASRNLEAVELLFPPPRRFVDSTGHTIGYAKAVVLPVALRVIDPARPVDLDLKVFFGVCREICIPAEASFKVTISPRQLMRWPPKLSEAVEALPVAAGPSRPPSAPTVKRIIPVSRSDGNRALLIDVDFPRGSSGGDLFAERGDGMGLAMTEIVARPSPDLIRFRLPVADAAEWTKLGETDLVLTIVSDNGSSTVRRQRP